jgi:hypothetical protein
MENNYQISFLPWFELLESITLGPINFWPFPRMAEANFKDKDIKTHLERYFRSYVDYQGSPVKGLTVCYHGDQISKVYRILNIKIFVMQ